MKVRVRPGRTQRGQAVMVAVVGLIVLAIGMYTSYNLSRAVYEKIKLQNAADAAAYSLATLEARTFNFMAFVNRAQVANYVQMLEVQSLLSNFTQMEGMTGFLGDFALSAAETCEALSVIPPLAWLSSFVGPLQLVGKLLYQTNKNVLELAVDGLEKYARWTIRLNSTKNNYLFAAAAMLMLTTELQLVDGGFDIVQANDPGARRSMFTTAVNVLNAAAFTTAFDYSSLGAFAIGSSEDAKLQAKRVMTEMVHATRYNDDSDAKFIVARGAFSGIEEAIGKLSGVLGEITGGDWGGEDGDGFLGTVTNVANILGGPFVGTAKLVAAEDGGYGDIADTGESTPDHSDLAPGSAIVAKDRPKLFGALPEEYFSVSSGTENSRHCRYERPSDLEYGRLGRAVFMFITPEAFGFGECKTYPEDDHRWRSLLFKAGIAPFFKFKPKRGGLQADKTSFNQPDVWMFLNKPPASMALGGVGDLDFDLRHGESGTAELDARIGEGGLFDSGFGEGINVIARAQVYYHRPGAWHEPPNLFNPFWAARLAPKNVLISRFTQELGLTNETIENLIQDNLWMH